MVNPAVVPWYDLPVAGTADVSPTSPVLMGVNNDLSQATVQQIVAAGATTSVFGLNAFTNPGTGLVISGTSLNIASSALSPGGTSGQVQYNNAGVFGGTTAGPFFTGTDAAQLGGTASVNLFNGGTAASSSTFLSGAGTWLTPSVAPSPTVNDAVTAAGADLAGATELTAGANTITTCPGGAGVKFRAAASDPVQTMRFVYNDTANTLLQYPDSGSQIGSLGTDTADQIFPGTGKIYVRMGATQWRAFSQS